MKASKNWPLFIAPALYSASLSNTSCVQVCSCIVLFTHPSIHPPIHTFLQQIYTKYLLWANLVWTLEINSEWERQCPCLYRVSTSLPCSSMPQCLCTCSLLCLNLIYSSRPSSNITSSFSSKVYASFLNFIHPLQRLIFHIF